MRWFKHMSDMLDDLFILQVMDHFGLEGYGAWVGLLEMYARYCGEHCGESVSIPWRVLTRKLKISPKKLGQFLGFFEAHGKIVWQKTAFQSTPLVTLQIPKMMELRDEWTTRQQNKTRESLSAKKIRTPDSLAFPNGNDGPLPVEPAFEKNLKNPDPDCYTPEYRLMECFKAQLRQKGVKTFDGKWCMLTIQAFQRLLKYQSASHIEAAFPWFLEEWALADGVVRGDHIEKNWAHYERHCGKQTHALIKPKRFERILNADTVQYVLTGELYQGTELEYVPPAQLGVTDHFRVKASGALLEGCFVHLYPGRNS